MGNAVWLAAPYLSMLVLCRWARIGRRLAGHSGLTLPVGWLAVLGLLAAVLEVWAPPTPVMVVLATLSGLAMVTTGGSRGGEGPRPEDHDDDPPPGLDWDAFDAARRRWDRDCATR